MAMSMSQHVRKQMMSYDDVIVYFVSRKGRSVITVFLSRFGTFLRSKLKLSKQPVQSSHHCVICAHQKSSFTFL